MREQRCWYRCQTTQIFYVLGRDWSASKPATSGCRPVWVLSDGRIKQKLTLNHRQWFGNNRAEHVEVVVGERDGRRVPKPRSQRPIILHVSMVGAIAVTSAQTMIANPVTIWLERRIDTHVCCRQSSPREAHRGWLAGRTDETTIAQPDRQGCISTGTLVSVAPQVGAPP